MNLDTKIELIIKSFKEKNIFDSLLAYPLNVSSMMTFNVTTPSVRTLSRLLFFLILSSLGCPSVALSQSLTYTPSENSTLPRRKYQDSEKNLKQAYEAYAAGNSEKTKYFLDQSEKDGAVSTQFYMLLGQYYYDQKQFGSAKRYWKRGYKKKGCYECKEKVAKIKMEK